MAFFWERGLRSEVLILPLQLLEPDPFGVRQLILATAIGFAVLCQLVTESLSADTVRLSNFPDGP